MDTETQRERERGPEERREKGEELVESLTALVVRERERVRKRTIRDCQITWPSVALGTMPRTESSRLLEMGAAPYLRIRNEDRSY